MLWKTYEAFRDRVEYSHNPDGSWRADFHGAFDVTVVAPTLERCRVDVQDALDVKLAEWISHPRKTRRVLKRPGRAGSQ